MSKIQSSRARSLLVASFMLITAVSIFFIFRGVTSAAAPSSINASKGSLSAAQCGPDWQVVPSPNPPNTNSSLNGIAVVTDNDVWAVGTSTYSTATLTLIEHWDGVSWSIVPSPNPSGTNDMLYAVAAVAADDVWAVGNDGRTLIEHWDGSTWSVIPGADPGPYSGELHGVTAIAADNVWAVGWDGTSAGLVEHWDGSRWSVVSTPDIGISSVLIGVAAVNRNDIWAVGYRALCAGGICSVYSLTEHWDGTTWSVVPSPNPDPQYSWLFGVTAVSTNDVWAVGPYPVMPIQHWDGSTWSAVPGTGGLSGVAVVSANDVWAVGNDGRTLVEHWDGSTWSVVPSPDPGTGTGGALSGVAAVSANDVWAVGHANGQTLVERYNPCNPATSTPTPTPQPPPCPGERFTDVCPGDYFYTATLALADDGILSGYNTVPPCKNSLWIPCFKPYNSSTRGQISKVVSLAAGFNEPVSGQTFEDVQPGSTFYTYTERMAERAIISGYPCGGAGEPCIPPGNRPYFRTNNNVTRGQLSKMISLAFGWNDPPVGQNFEDVAPGSTFYTYVAQLYSRGIIEGYPCGDAGEPCVPPDNLPYFRPNSNVLRGQTAKIVELARTQPTATPTPVFTATPTQTPTNPDCQGIPAPQDMQISPGNCETIGTTLTFLGTGFQPNENAALWLTAPDGSVFGPPNPNMQADNNGDVGPLTLDTSSLGSLTGLWHLTFQGTTSQHQAIGPFMMLAPEPPPKR